MMIHSWSGELHRGMPQLTGWVEANYVLVDLPHDAEVKGMGVTKSDQTSHVAQGTCI